MQEKELQKTPIQLKLVTEIRDRGRKENFSMVMDGMIYWKEEATYISCKEMVEGVGKVTNILKIKVGEVTLIRSGGIMMNHTYIKGKTTTGKYQGPYGAIEIITKTENIDYTYNAKSKKAKLLLAYQLEMQGEAVGRHRLTFFIEEKN